MERNEIVKNLTESFGETLASVSHAIWAHWMRYMFSCGKMNEDGSWSMPAEKAERWQRQMNTEFSGLSEQEKLSDFEQANKIIGALTDKILR